MKIVTVVGARPQFVKAAAFSRVWRAQAGCREVLVHTGQHYDDNMSNVFFRELGIPTPEVNLGIGSGNHGEQTGRMMAAIEKVLLRENPDTLLVYGDTNSTLAGALAAAKLHIPVAHIEAGLRSFNRSMPEETNRVLTDHVSDWLLVPTANAATNLRREGLGDRRIHHVGDVMFDIALLAGPLAEKHAKLPKALGLGPGGYLLSTLHRAETTDDPAILSAVLTALAEIGRTHPVVLPMHPRTRKLIASLDVDLSSLKLIEPVGYLDMLSLTRGARAVITDSGGLQKEAYFHRVPCLTLRKETEWTELLDCGWNRLVPPRPDPRFHDDLRNALELASGPAPEWKPLYGDGRAAEMCTALLLRHEMKGGQCESC